MAIKAVVHCVKSFICITTSHPSAENNPAKGVELAPFYKWGMKITATSFKSSHVHTAALNAPDPAAGCCWPTPHSLGPDILECEVKWALESITTNKASGGGGIPDELFQILKNDAMKVLHSKCQQIWKTQQWPQDWKRSVFISMPKKGNAKERQCQRMLKLPHNCTHLTC